MPFWALASSLSRGKSTGVEPRLLLTWIVSEIAASARRWLLTTSR